MRLSAIQASRSFLRSRQGSNTLCAVAPTDLSLEEGSLTALSGPSGSGKSTLLNMFAGLLPPSEGQILLDGRDLYQMDDRELSRIRNHHIGVIPQGQTALQALNVQENILVPYYLSEKTKGDAWNQAQRRAEELMEQAGIAELKQEMPPALSGGELRRVAVCRVLLLQPEIILADEPTGNLDEANENIVLDIFQQLHGEGTTLIVVTHDPEVGEVAQRTVTLEYGKIKSDEKNADFGREAVTDAV